MDMKRILSMMTVVALATGSAAAMTVDEALKVSVSKLELNAKVEDSYFALPKDCKVVDLKSAAEAAKVLGAGLLPKK